MVASAIVKDQSGSGTSQAVKSPSSIRYVASPIFAMVLPTMWYVGGRSAVASSRTPVFVSRWKVPRTPDSRVGPWSMTTWPIRTAVFVGKS